MISNKLKLIRFKIKEKKLKMIEIIRDKKSFLEILFVKQI